MSTSASELRDRLRAQYEKSRPKDEAVSKAETATTPVVRAKHVLEPGEVWFSSVLRDTGVSHYAELANDIEELGDIPITVREGGEWGELQSGAAIPKFSSFAHFKWEAKDLHAMALAYKWRDSVLLT